MKSIRYAISCCAALPLLVAADGSGRRRLTFRMPARRISSSASPIRVSSA